MHSSVKQLLILVIVVVFLVGCAKPPPREEVISRLVSTDDPLGPDFIRTAQVCSPMLGYYDDRALLGERWELGISISGLVAGVAGAALVSVPANAIWVAVLSAYGGATNMASQKLRGGGLDGGEAAAYRVVLDEQIRTNLALALDTTKPPPERRNALLLAQVSCALELGPRTPKFSDPIEPMPMPEN
ncbi:hypothetical protein [Candidatus Thiosymbion oneisti]|uniref:hypothetical protein n=1 Tax=Candidatus Thiosymbion oneisti TaxID=589554 RepID=UPI0010603883|nr:hypothetical protein [Candidatus Thiosymbion oneisti]